MNLPREEKRGPRRAPGDYSLSSGLSAQSPGTGRRWSPNAPGEIRPCAHCAPPTVRRAGTPRVRGSAEALTQGDEPLTLASNVPVAGTIQKVGALGAVGCARHGEWAAGRVPRPGVVIVTVAVPRPKLHSDEAILDAAMEVLLRRGPADFTLNDVAVALGMSRAALIQRFKNKDTLYMRVMARSGEQRRDYLAGMPVEAGARGLWRFLTDIVSGMGTGEGLDSDLLFAWQDLKDTTLRRMALERNLLVREAIAARLP